jgi:hypothetical protein
MSILRLVILPVFITYRAMPPGALLAQLHTTASGANQIRKIKGLNLLYNILQAIAY